MTEAARWRRAAEAAHRYAVTGNLIYNNSPFLCDAVLQADDVDEPYVNAMRDRLELFEPEPPHSYAWWGAWDGYSGDGIAADLHVRVLAALLLAEMAEDTP